MNAFFASVEMNENPKLKNLPVAVCGKVRRSVISSANYLARSLGINAAMPVYMAQKICHNLVLIDHHFSLYEKYSQQFIFIIKQHLSKNVELASIDECYVDVSNIVNNKIEALKKAKMIQKIIYQKIGIGTSIGISNNKFLAKMASDIKKPMGITELYPDQIEKKL